MTTTLVSGDWQLSQNPRDSYRFTFLKWLSKKIEREKVEHLIMLGDLTEEKEGFNAEFVNRIADWFYAVPCPVSIVMGNHDYVDEAWPFFRFLGHMEHVNFIQQRELLPRKPTLFLPYTKDYQRDWAQINWSVIKEVFTHNTFAGAKIGITVKGTPLLLDGIPPTAIPKHVKVYAGDVHTPQTVGHIVYVGAPYTVDFGDDYKGRVLLLNRGLVSSIPYEGPQKRLITIDNPTQLNQRYRGVHDKDLLKVRVTYKRDINWPKMRDEIKAWAEKSSYSLHTVELARDSKSFSKPTRERISFRDDKTILNEYGKSRSVPDKVMVTGRKLIT